MTKKAPPPGILNFWGPKPEAPAEAPAKRRPGAAPELHPVAFQGQVYKFVIEAPDETHARGALGALLKAVLSAAKARKAFERQSLYPSKPLGPVTELTLGETTLFAKAGSGDPARAGAMAIDRLAFALTECRLDPQVDEMIKTIGLRIITNT